MVLTNILLLDLMRFIHTRDKTQINTGHNYSIFLTKPEKVFRLF